MKITILSGGSGNDSLIKGLKEFYKDAEIKVIVNAYDNGKSTGVCRKITDTLGVSDIRKNHIRMYKAISDIVDQRFVDFFEGRFDLINPKEDSIKLLRECNILNNWPKEVDSPENYLTRFFDEVDKNYPEIQFNNFCVGNILYAQMYKELGYEKTNKTICDLLGIDDFVLLNSFDNVYLNAILDDNNILKDEGDIVDLADFNKKITNIFYTNEKTLSLNPKALDEIENCNLLVLSTGTFWSSIYPTLDYGNLFNFVNHSKARKIWVMNNEFDKDSYGVHSVDFIRQVNKLGINLKDFTILINNDAIPELQETDEELVGKTVRYSMGNTNGKHNGLKYAKAILSIYYNLDDSYDRILFDFDDTLWSRDYLDNKYLHKLSRKCINFIGNTEDNLEVVIISGNNKDSVFPKLQSVYGLNLEKFEVPVWLMAHASKYVQGKKIDSIEDFKIDDSILEDLNELIEDKDKIILIGEDNYISNIRIKPLQQFERTILHKYLSEVILHKYPDLAAYMTGRSTIDIVKKNNTKAYIFYKEGFDKLKTLYIGDEIDVGNDRDIAKLCTKAISTSGVEETYMLIRLLLENLK